jgi:preprotein translocase subunit SecD
VLPASETATAPGQQPIKTTPPENDDPKSVVVLPEIQNGKVVRRYALGPAELTGKALASATATISQTGQWQVDFTTTGSGSTQWDQLAQRNFQKQVAIDLDGVVKSAPQINAQAFNGKGQITGNFTQQQAKDLALVLRYGSLPVQLVPQTVETVSATLGKDSLSAGIIAGIVGLALVALYMVLYYRALGFVVWLGLAVTGALMYSIITWLGKSNGLALSLPGATGIIVSVGVTVDSYVVYFERLKDEIRSGKTIRSSVDRGFSRAYRTILAADTVSFIAAVLLYFLSVGAVRGFAFFLGLSTLLDVFTAYFFTRPMVVLLGRNRFFTEARWMGVARGLAAPGAAAEAT